MTRQARRWPTSGLLSLVCLAAAAAGPVQEWRALALASFDEAWQVIRDSYYDPSFGGLDWAAVRRTLRPDVEGAETPEAARGVIRTLLSRLHQSHFALLAASAVPGAPAGTAVVDIDVRVIGDAVVVTSVGDGAVSRAGILPGDRLLAIDGQPVEHVAAGQAGTDPHARRALLARLVLQALHGAAGSAVPLDLAAPDGTVRSVVAEREAEAGTPVRLGNLPSMRVRTAVARRTTPAGHTAGIVAFNVWMPAVAGPFGEAVDRFRQADGLVIDLRGNPGGLADMIRGLAGHLLDQPALIGRMAMRDAELEIRANPRRSMPDGRRVEPYAGPVAILVDELTGSASECFAGGLQSLGRARIFGSRSMGQALPAATHDLPNGDVLLYAVGDFITSTGMRIEGTGVVPDEAVPLTVADLVAGRDEAVEAALRWIDRRHAVRNGRRMTTVVP